MFLIPIKEKEECQPWGEQEEAMEWPGDECKETDMEVRRETGRYKEGQQDQHGKLQQVVNGHAHGERDHDQ